jgi:CRISPR-associated protein Cmr2
VVALVNQPPVELGEAVKEAILKRLREIREEAYSKVTGTFDHETAKLQVDDMLEFFWAACPVSGNYHQAREQAEALMAARKVTRDFAAVTWGSSTPKSSLDGQRESVIPEAAYDRMTEEELRRKYGVRVGERLCGVGLLKRHGKRGSGADRFFSTSHVAALPLLQRLNNQGATDEYIQTLRKLGISPEELGSVPESHPVFGRYDGHLLFEERLSEFFEDREKLQEAKAALGKFRRTALDDQSPIPYYALLLADGDRMGKAINEQKTPEAHRELSQHLSCFARKVADIIKQHNGSLVYSGGDDVLAFVPLHRVLACARCLAQTFRQELASFRMLEDGKETSPTLSVGIVVAHHLEPLTDALALARAAEKAAKSVPGKNALAVTVSKRSGSDRTVAGTWGTLDRRLEQFIVLHRSDAIPDGAAFELRDLALRLGFLEEAMRKEALRILRRKEAQRGLQPVAKHVLGKLDELINRQQVPIAQLAEELIIAREFAVAEDQANSPLIVEGCGEV